MLVDKCDICKKEIASERVVKADIGRAIAMQAFCPKCAKPVVDFLNKLNKNKSEKPKRK